MPLFLRKATARDNSEGFSATTENVHIDHGIDTHITNMMMPIKGDKPKWIVYVYVSRL